MEKSDPLSEGKDNKKSLSDTQKRDKKITDLEYKAKKLTRKKYFSEHLAYQLYYQNEGSNIRKSYQKTIYCSKELRPNKEGGLSALRCKARWCPLCQSIRIMKLIKGYSSALSELEDAYFVTLTAPTVTEDKLKERIKHFAKSWRLITSTKYWKANKPNGIRKAECTLRPNGHYHYHFHVIIDGKENAKWLISQWLKRNKGSDIKAQDMRAVKKGEYIELFKYFTKLISSDKTARKERRYIDFVRLDVIFRNLRGTRVYQPFGNVKAVEEEIIDEELDANDDLKGIVQQVWHWATNIGYIGEETGEILAGDYELPKWVEAICGKLPLDKKEGE